MTLPDRVFYFVSCAILYFVVFNILSHTCQIFIYFFLSYLFHLPSTQHLFDQRCISIFTVSPLSALCLPAPCSLFLRNFFPSTNLCLVYFYQYLSIRITPTSLFSFFFFYFSPTYILFPLPTTPAFSETSYSSTHSLLSF